MLSTVFLWIANQGETLENGEARFSFPVAEALRYNAETEAYEQVFDNTRGYVIYDAVRTEINLTSPNSTSTQAVIGAIREAAATHDWEMRIDYGAKSCEIYTPGDPDVTVGLDTAVHVALACLTAYKEALESLTP